MKRIALLLLVISACLASYSPEDFDSSRARDASEIAPDSLREPLFEAFADAGGNWGALSGFTEGLKGERLADAIWMINTMPHLDRLLATEDILREHLEYAYRVKENAPWPIPADMFRPYILAYRISYEPVTAWRKDFYERFYPGAEKAGTPGEAAKIVNRWVSENIDTAGHDFFGGMQPPDLTFERARGTRSEIAALTTAILKAIGIPSRNAMIRNLRGEKGGMSWVEIFDAESEEWIPLYPRHPDYFGDFNFPEKEHPGGLTTVLVRGGFDMELVTENYGETGFLKCHFSRAGNPAADWEHFSVCVRGSGAYWPLDEIGAQADSMGDFEIQLGIGDYVLQSGVRDRTGSVWVQTVPFEIFQGDTTPLEVAVDAPQYLDLKPPPEGRFPVFTLVDLSGKPFSHNQVKGKKPLVMFIFDPAGEPSVRAQSMLEVVGADYSDSLRIVAAAVLDSSKGAEDLETPWRTLVDRNGELTKSLTGVSTLERIRNEKLPLVLFCGGDEIAYEVVAEGYNTNLESLLRERVREWFENER